MQRKVFEIAGEPRLATRDGSLFETAGTLQQMIADRLRQPAERTAQPEVPPPVAKPEARALPEPEPAPVTVEATSLEPDPEPTDLAATAIPGKPARPGPRAERWRTAGPERRGRTGQHWSTRRKA